MSIREKFVAQFGEEQADAIEAAAESHKNGVHDRKGSDPFKWTILIAIGYECISRPEFREAHGITVPYEILKPWIVAEADLASHDGECDYLTLFCGKYNEFVRPAGGAK